MRSNYKKLGGYIRPVDERNSDGALGEDNLYGISVTKEFIISHANLVGVTFDGYKVVAPRQFAYIPDTSRRGDKTRNGRASARRTRGIQHQCGKRHGGTH